MKFDGNYSRQMAFQAPVFHATFRRSTIETPLGRRTSFRARTITRSALSMSDLDPLFRNTAHAQSIFDSYTHPLPSGTAELARSRNLPIDALSTAYGHILAKNILSDLPISLNHDKLASSCQDAMTCDMDLDPAKFDTYLSRIRLITPKSPDPNLSSEQLDEFSGMYGAMLGRTVRLAALELNPAELSTGLSQRLNDQSLPFPMKEEEYDTAFNGVQDCAADILGTSNVEAADTFFKTLKENDAVQGIQKDGYIFAVPGQDVALESEPAVTASDIVHVVFRVRLLDGRTLVLPVYQDDEPDFVEIPLAQVPAALSGAMSGMRVGECRTVFYHPYAACEIMRLFVAERLPPQSGLVIDILLKTIV